MPKGNTYYSIDDIKIWVFYEILKTNDLSLLGKHENPEDVWIDIYNDYCIKSKVSTDNIKQISRVQALENKYNYVIGCLEILRSSYYLREVEGFIEIHEKALAMLSSKGYVCDTKKVFEEEFLRLCNQSESLKMKIEIENEKVEKVDKKLAINLWKEIAQLHKATGIKLKPKKDVIAYLIEVRNMALEQTKRPTSE